MVTQKHVGTGRVGAYYRVLLDILDENNAVVNDFWYCPICKDVINLKAMNGTNPLTRHVVACESTSFLFSTELNSLQ